MPATKPNAVELSCAAANEEVFADLELELFDAVYLGQPYCLKTKRNFLAQADDLKRAVATLHSRGTKAYVSSPIVPTISEFPQVEKALQAACEAGADAVEVWDAGVYRFVRRCFPDMPVHIASTMNIYQPDTAAYYRDTGAARLVPANELLADEVDEIVAAVPGVEFAVPVHGHLPLGMAFSCMLRMKFPSLEKSACRNQCDEAHYLDMGDWRMRCVGTANVTAEDFCVIEHLGVMARKGFAGYRMETHFDDAEKVNSLGRVYREALALAQSPDYGAEGFRDRVLAISGSVCNGWRFGLPGRMYQGLNGSDVYAEASRKAKSGALGGVADAG